MRQGQAADISAIRELTRAAYAKWIPLIGREPKPMGADYETAIRAHRFDLLYRDGVLSALVETIVQPDHLLIENLAVLPACQGLGLGRKLMAHVERLAAAQGFAEVRLYTNKLFAANIAFYARLGYRVFKEEEWPGRGIAVHMSKAIAP